MTRTLRACVLVVLTSLTTLPAGAQPEPPRVTVTEISVLGNTLLPPAAIDAALAPYKGQRSLAELQDAARTLQALYRDAGYGAVVTFLPEQAVAGGKLVIGVLEGRLARIAVIGNKQFSADNVRRALPALQAGTTPRVRLLDRQVQLANENPARKLALTLEPGKERGEVDATVNVAEDAASRWFAFADNTGSRQTGRLRLGLAYRHAALWDLDHHLSVQAQFSPEHPSKVRIFGGSYRVPLYPAGLLLNLYGTYSSVDAGTTSTAAGSLQFNGKGRAVGVSLTRLLERWGEFDQRISVALDSRDYLNNCSIQGLPPGACGIAGESVTVQPLTLEYSLQRGGERPAGASVALSRNLDLGGRYSGQVDAVRPGAPRNYTVLRANAHATVAVGGDWRVGPRLSVQATGDALVPGEQFGLSGAAAVRGYEEREVTGDSGAVASVELLSPELGPGGLRAAAFGDAGVVRNELGTPCGNDTRSRCTLAAVGLGARFALGPSQWRLDVARALKDGRGTDKGSARLHLEASMPFR